MFFLLMFNEYLLFLKLALLFEQFNPLFFIY